MGQRWPMSNPGSCTESPAPGFSESPVAYLVYFAWNNTDRVTTILSPSYQETGQKSTIVKGSGAGWMYFGNPWPASSQSWLNAGKSNTPPSAASWTELDLGAFSGKSKYVYVMWHKNGTYRPDAARYRFYDYTLDKQVSIVNETLHADGLNHADDTFSGWYQLGKTKINITPSTRLRVSQDAPVAAPEYLQSDAVLLTDYPVVDNTSLGAAENFESMPVLSVSDTGPTGLGNHWGMQGLGQQYTVTGGKSWTARIDSNVVSDVPAGNYYVEVSWTYFYADNTNVTNAKYHVNGTLLSDVINQNRSATNQAGSFVQGNSVGTWSGFYRLSGTYYYHKTSNPLSVSMVYDSSLYGGKRLVADMVRFVSVTP